MNVLLSRLMTRYMAPADDATGSSASEPSAADLLAKEEAAAVERGDVILDPAKVAADAAAEIGRAHV